jgi:hypothetical protein
LSQTHFQTKYYPQFCKIAAPNGIIAKLSMRLILPLVEIHFHLLREVLRDSHDAHIRGGLK